MVKIQFTALIAFSLIGCAHTAANQTPTPQLQAPDNGLATDLFYQNAKIESDIYHVDGWDGDISAIAARVAAGLHDRGASTDLQQESRNGTRISFSASKEGRPNRYKVIVQELSRDPGIILVLYAAWPEDLDAAFSKQFEIQADEIIRRMVIEPADPVHSAPSI